MLPYQINDQVELRHAIEGLNPCPFRQTSTVKISTVTAITYISTVDEDQCFRVLLGSKKMCLAAQVPNQFGDSSVRLNFPFSTEQFERWWKKTVMKGKSKWKTSLIADTGQR